ncbi:MAG: hypothetical protein ACYC69_02870 [Thermodesulfovibrionales bacterium]
MFLIQFLTNSLLLGLFLHVIMGGFGVQVMIIIGVYIFLGVLATAFSKYLGWLNAITPFLMIGLFIYLAIQSLAALSIVSFGEAYMLGASIIVGTELFITEVLL